MSPRIVRAIALMDCDAIALAHHQVKNEEFLAISICIAIASVFTQPIQL
ncbi:hypothetical protein [Trichocoleus sp. DQ-U1]